MATKRQWCIEVTTFDDGNLTKVSNARFVQRVIHTSIVNGKQYVKAHGDAWKVYEHITLHMPAYEVVKDGARLSSAEWASLRKRQDKSYKKIKEMAVRLKVEGA